jgi:hypothetical protein
MYTNMIPPFAIAPYEVEAAIALASSLVAFGPHLRETCQQRNKDIIVDVSVRDRKQRLVH